MSVAVVAGGSGGLGRAICARLRGDGHDVVVGYRKNAAAAEETARELGGCAARRVDLADAAALEALFAELGAVDVVVHAAGADIGQPYLSQVTEEAWRALIDEELHGFFRLVRASLPSLRRARGALVAVTSAGLLRYPARDVMSVAPKAAITQLVTALAREEGRHGVRANCVAPGVIEAGIFLRLRGETFTPEWLASMTRNIALRRFGTADEVADAVAFLARATYVTGQTLAVDGGFSA